MRLEGVFAVEVYRGVQIWGQCSYDECQYWSDLETYTYDTVPEVRIRIDIILGGVTYLSSLEVQIVNPQYGTVYVQAPGATIISGLYMFITADVIMIEMQPKAGYVMGNVYIDGGQVSVPPEGGQLTLKMNVNHVVLLNFATETPEVPDDEYIGAYKGYDVWRDYFIIGFNLENRYRVYEAGTHLNRLYESPDLDKCYEYIDELTKPDIPVTWVGPETLESGVYRWSIKLNIVPIPFLDNWITDIITGTQNDEANLNRIMKEQGATGTATIISKEVTKHTNWMGTVDSATITYTVAFTTGPALGAPGQTLVFPFALIIPFIPWIAGTVIAIIIYLAIRNITSTLTKITGPSEYAPNTPEDCADGWTYDASTGLCVKTEDGLTGYIPLIVGGAVVTAILLRGKG